MNETGVDMFGICALEALGGVDMGPYSIIQLYLSKSEGLWPLGRIDWSTDMDLV